MHECKNAPMQECRNAGMQECRNAGMQLFSLVLASMLADLHLTRGQGGALNSITLITAAAGGLAFGVADRYGRKRAHDQHPSVIGLQRALRPVPQRVATGNLQCAARIRHGRRVGRIASAAAPFVIGSLAASHGFGVDLSSPAPRFFSPKSRCNGCRTRAATTCSDRGARSND